MNIKPQGEHLAKGRFISGEKRAKINYENDKRRERQGKRVIKLHESFTDNKLPSTEDLIAWVKEYKSEFNRIPNTLLITNSTKTKKVILYIPGIGTALDTVTLEIRQSEFYGVEFCQL